MKNFLVKIKSFFCNLQKQKAKKFDKKFKHGDRVLFYKLPLNRIFYSPEDHKEFFKKCSSKFYFKKIGLFMGLVVFSTAKEMPVGKKFIVKLRTPVIYLGIVI